MKVWVTKYALTSGIQEFDAERSENFPSTIIVPGRFQQSFHGDDWHLTFEAAQIRAEEMRMAKIRGLKKSLLKLENLKFSAAT